ncbi:MAG: aminotransferase class I/II-fold pyridoxal phosphate-dependent enzyme [Gammaproteobacteria bacterium]|jgi:glycine C-acetyltransferase
MSVKLKKAIAREMQNMDAAGLLRSETAVVQTASMEVQVNDDETNKSYLNFVGNDFLGWGSNDVIRDTASEALARYGAGNTSSRITIGTQDVIKQLEEKLSGFLDVEDSIVFPSHYLANLSIFEPLTSRRDSIFIDEMCNPGLYDGARMSQANIVPFRYQDSEDLEYHLKCSQNARFRIVATDSVFHSDGYLARLQTIKDLSENYDAITVVDDSLGAGIVGENGRGIINHLQMEDKPELVTGTFAYALGNVSGGFISGDSDLIKWLRHTARPYLLSEPISPVNAAIVTKVVEILEADDTVLNRYHANSKYLKDEIRKKDWQLKRNNSPLVSINVGSTLNAQKMVEFLYNNNILVSGLCYPNTPEGESLLRMNITASHTRDQIRALVEALEEAFDVLE